MCPRNMHYDYLVAICTPFQKQNRESFLVLLQLKSAGLKRTHPQKHLLETLLPEANKIGVLGYVSESKGRQRVSNTKIMPMLKTRNW